MHHRGKALGLALLLGLAAQPAPAAAAELAGAGAALSEMEVMGVAPDPASGAPLVYLRSKADRRELGMYIGPFETQGILLPLQAMRPARPYTHDLMLEAIHRLQATVKRVVITDLRDNTYFASVVLDARGQEVTLDARPSDAIALALRENAPILAADKLLREAPRGGRPDADTRGGS